MRNKKGIYNLICDWEIEGHTGGNGKPGTEQMYVLVLFFISLSSHARTPAQRDRIGEHLNIYFDFRQTPV